VLVYPEPGALAWPKPRSRSLPVRLRLFHDDGRAEGHIGRGGVAPAVIAEGNAHDVADMTAVPVALVPPAGPRGR